MGKTSKSGLGVGVGTSPQGSITQGDFDDKVKELLEKDNQLKLLIAAKVKFNGDDVLFVTKDKSGQMIWLEKGNDGVGLKHILIRHADDFHDKHNVSIENIVGHLNNIISNGNVEYSRIIKRGNYAGIEKLYSHKGKYYLLTGIGTNGFIVSAYPINEKEAIKLKARYKNDETKRKNKINV